MKKQIILICLVGITACVNDNQTIRGLHALNPENLARGDDTPDIIQQFSSLCLSERIATNSILKKAEDNEWYTATDAVLEKENLSKLKKKILKIPGGGTPIEESQVILAKSIEDEVLVLELSERFARKQLTSGTCTIFGKGSGFLRNCASLGKLINRAPDQNTRYKESGAHFIGWNILLAGRQATIKCQYIPDSPTLSYEGTRLSLGIDHITPIKTANLKKSSQPQSDASGR